MTLHNSNQPTAGITRTLALFSTRIYPSTFAVRWLPTSQIMSFCGDHALFCRPCRRSFRAHRHALHDTLGSASPLRVLVPLLLRATAATVPLGSRTPAIAPLAAGDRSHSGEFVFNMAALVGGRSDGEGWPRGERGHEQASGPDAQAMRPPRTGRPGSTLPPSPAGEGSASGDAPFAGIRRSS